MTSQPIQALLLRVTRETEDVTIQCIHYSQVTVVSYAWDGAISVFGVASTFTSNGRIGIWMSGEVSLVAYQLGVLIARRDMI